jgi:tetratricopeptide (TPR) repeat protein
MTKRLSYLTVAALAALATNAQAAPSSGPAAKDSAEVELARSHFQRGADLYREGNFDGALAEFNRAFQTVPNYRVLYNIGQVQAERHDYVAALHAFEDYLRQGAADVAPDRRAQVERDITNLKGRISELNITSNVEGAELSVDGLPVGRLPLRRPLLVSAGMRRLSLTKRGYSPAEKVVSVTGGDKPEIPMLLERLDLALGADARGAPHRAGSGQSSVNVGGWVSLAATGLFTSGAVAFGLLARAENDELDQQLSRMPQDTSKVSDTRAELKLYAGITDASAGLAIVSAVFTGYFFLSGPSDTARPAPAKSSARFVPFGRGLAVLGDF